jgi:hypothetical protein
VDSIVKPLYLGSLCTTLCWNVQVAAVVAYLVCSIFSASYVINFVVTAALLAIDFWIVKNVTGRLLVGLRWWNDVDEQGRSTWRFESLDQQVFFSPLQQACLSGATTMSYQRCEDAKM